MAVNGKGQRLESDRCWCFPRADRFDIVSHSAFCLCYLMAQAESPRTNESGVYLVYNPPPYCNAPLSDGISDQARAARGMCATLAKVGDSCEAGYLRCKYWASRNFSRSRWEGSTGCTPQRG